MNPFKLLLISLGIVSSGSAAYAQSEAETPDRSMTLAFASSSSSATATSDKSQALSVIYSEKWDSGEIESWRLTGSRQDSNPPIAGAFRDTDQLSFGYSRSVALSTPGRRAGFDFSVGYNDFYEDLAGPVTTGNRRSISLGANILQAISVDASSAVIIRAGVGVGYFDEETTDEDASDASRFATLALSYGRLLNANGMLGSIGLSAVTGSQSLNLDGDKTSVDGALALRIPIGQNEANLLELSASTNLTGDESSAENFSISWTRNY